jgi:hypothetical protein
MSSLYQRIVDAVPAKILPLCESTDKTLAQAYLEGAGALFSKARDFSLCCATNPEIRDGVDRIRDLADEYYMRGTALTKDGDETPYFSISTNGTSPVVAIVDDVRVSVFVSKKTKTVRYMIPRCPRLRILPESTHVFWKGEGDTFFRAI